MDDRTGLWHVWPLDRDGNEIASRSEFRTATHAEAISQASDMALAACADFAGWKTTRAEDDSDDDL
jgi:hypothetical protein